MITVTIAILVHQLLQIKKKHFQEIVKRTLPNFEKILKKLFIGTAYILINIGNRFNTLTILYLVFYPFPKGQVIVVTFIQDYQEIRPKNFEYF